MRDTMTFYKAGERVPEWLLAVEPHDANSPNNVFAKFAVDCLSFERGDTVYLLPVAINPAIIVDTAGQPITVTCYAPTKTVAIPVNWQVVRGREAEDE